MIGTSFLPEPMYIDAITAILNSAGIWKINIIYHPGITATDKEFEIGTDKLTAINQLLKARLIIPVFGLMKMDFYSKAICYTHRT